MNGEIDEVVDQAADVPDASDAQAEAEFAAGFSSETVPTPTPEPEPEESAAPVADEPKYVQITERQLAELVEGRQKLDQAFGSIGGLKQALERLQASTQAGQAVAVTAEDIADLTDEFPELGGAALKTFQKVASKFKGTASDPQEIERIVTERMKAAEDKRVKEDLDDIVGGDWIAEGKSAAWQQWFAAQPEGVKALGASDQLNDAKKLMRLYVAAKNAPAPRPSPPAPPSARQRQLAVSVNPRSTGGAPAGKTPEDEFNEGFNSRNR